MAKIVFPDEEVSYITFITTNRNILNEYIDKSYIFDFNDDKNLDVSYAIKGNTEGYAEGDIIIRHRDNQTQIFNKIKSIITSIKITSYFSYDKNKPTKFEAQKTTGGSKASVKKEICGKLRCIYKIAGSRKEHIKYKGRLIAVADYKKLMKKA
jgi:hypothetical protein